MTRRAERSVYRRITVTLSWALTVALMLGIAPASEAEQHYDLRIVIDTIPDAQQRYPTVGDWRVDKTGHLHITRP